MKLESNYEDVSCVNNKLSIKRFLSVFLLSILIIYCVIPGMVSEAAVPKTTKVTLSKTAVSLYKGQLYKLTAKKANTKVKHKSVKWSTSNKKIVIVNQKGYIKGVKKGSAYVYCKVKWKNNKTTTVKCKVKVYNPVKAKSFKLNKTTIKLKPGMSTTLKRVITPSNATITKVAYATSNKKVATVNSKGVVVAKGIGSAKICCAIKTYNGKVYKRYATVKVWIPLTKITLNKTSGSLYVGQSTTLKATITPSNATYNLLTYKSSNKKVATVSSKGVVTAVGVGSADITVTTQNNKIATYKVVVMSPYEIKMDKTKLDLKVEVSGNVKATVTRRYGDAKLVSYSSSNEKVATVDNAGQVVAVSEGTAIITAKVINPTVGVPDTYNKSTCTVKVTKLDNTLKYTKEPYISTYYFDPKPSCKADIVIPVYITDTDNKEYLLNDDSKRFDMLLEVDGKQTYIRDIEPGDCNINIGKLKKGNHYFAMQVIDKDTGLKSHKLYNDLMVIDPDEYAIKDSEIYYMTEEDLAKYSIDNTNNENETICIETKNGLNQLFVDIKEAGYRKIVLLKGTYRIECENDRNKALNIPSYFTVDMNGSTIKLNTVEENDVGVSIFRIKDAIDAHLTNGTLEGDRFERRELGLETAYNGEGINTFLFNGCNNCSITNMTIKNTTGHTIGTQYVWGPVTGISSYTKTDIVDGKEVESSDRSTSNMVDLTKLKAWSDYVSIGQAEGYRGIKGNSALLYVHFYDKDKNYMHTVTGYQFRKIRIPEDAVYSRVTMLGELTVEHNVSYHSKHLGDYLKISDIDFIDTRTTALAPSSCNNLLIENVTYTRAGNSITPCAVDFEDGWQECQDVYYRNNKVIETSGTATVIDNTGYNHVYENLEGHRMIIRRGVMGTVIRNCDDNTEFNGNIGWTLGNSIVSKYNRVYDVKTGNINVSISESDIQRGAPKFIVKDCEIYASYISSTNSHVTYDNCVFPTFNGSNVNIYNSIIYPTSYLGANLYFSNCEFRNLEKDGGDIIFKFNANDAVREFNKCKFYGKTSFANNNYFNSVICNNCTFEDLNLSVGLSGEESTPEITFNSCNISSTANDFIYLGPYAYSRGRVNIQFNNSVLNLSSGNLIYMYGKPTLDSKIIFNKCTLNKSEGALIGGYGSISNVSEIALDMRFRGCIMNKTLDDSYKGTGNQVKVIYE